MTQEVMAYLFQSPEAAHILELLEITRMSLEECLKQAAALNADTTHPFVLLCGPILDGVVP